MSLFRYAAVGGVATGSPRTPAALPGFLVVAAMGAVLNSVIVWAGNTVGLHYLTAQFIAALLVVYLTYHLNSLWSFA